MLADRRRPPGSDITTRQRLRFDELWRGGRPRPLSSDRIRYAQWRPYLHEPIVELGAGDGLFARSFPDLDVVSIDHSITGIRQAPSPRLLASVDRVPLRSGSARTVLLAEVLEHVARPEEVLRECRRVCHPEGRLLISVPGMPLAAPEWAFHRLRTGRRPTVDNLPAWDPEHERRYTRPALGALLASCGWRVDEDLVMFGSATTAAIYWLEPLLGRVAHRPVNVAHRLAWVDRRTARWDAQSCIAYRCSPL